MLENLLGLQQKESVGIYLTVAGIIPISQKSELCLIVVLNIMTGH